MFKALHAEFVPTGSLTRMELLLMVEEMWWYYIDVYRLLHPDNPSLAFDAFVFVSSRVVRALAVLERPSSTSSAFAKLSAEFAKYKNSIDCYGAVILDAQLEYVLLVQGFRGSRWGLP